MRVKLERCETAGVIVLVEAIREDGAVLWPYAGNSSVAFEDVQTVASSVVCEASERSMIECARSSFFLEESEFLKVATLLFGAERAAGRPRACGARRGRGGPPL